MTTEVRQTSLPTSEAYAVAPGEGDAYTFLNTLMVVKAGGDQTRGAYALLENVLPGGFAPPLHVHTREDEGFYVLSGEALITCGEESWHATPGTFALLPRDVPHTFSVGESGARLLILTSQAQFEHFVADVGESTERYELPEPGPVDGARLAEIAAGYGIQLLGGPPV